MTEGFPEEVSRSAGRKEEGISETSYNRICV